MTNANLTLVIDALNNASKGLKDIRNDLKGLDAQAKTSGGSLARIRDVAAGFVVGRGIEQGLGKLKTAAAGALRAANDQARAEAQLNAVLKSTNGTAGVTAAQANKLASAFQGSTKYMDEQVLSAENVLLTFTNIKSNIFPAATAATLDLSTALGQDLQSSAIQVGKALNDPIRGVTALRRVGVSFTTDQEKMIQSLVESGQTLKAQEVILQELSKEFGGSANAMTPFEKNIDSIKDRLADANEAVGKFIQGGVNLLFSELGKHKGDFQAVYGVAAQIFPVIKQQAETHLGGLIGVVKNVAKAIGDTVNVFENIAHGRWGAAWQSLKDVALDALKVLANGAAAVFGAIPNMAISGINKAIDAISGRQLIPEIGLGKAGAALGISNLPGVSIPDLSGFHIPEIKTELFDIGKAIGTVGDAAGPATPPIVGVGDAIEGVGDSAESTRSKLKDILSGVISAGADLFSRPTREQAELKLSLDEEKQAHNQLRPAIEDTIAATNRAADAASNQADALDRAADSITSAAKKVADGIDDRISVLKDSLSNLNDGASAAADGLDRQARSNQRAREAGIFGLQDQLDALRNQRESIGKKAPRTADEIARAAIDAQIDQLEAQIKTSQRGAQAAADADKDRADSLKASTDSQKKAIEDQIKALEKQKDTGLELADTEADRIKQAAENKRKEAEDDKKTAAAQQRRLDQMDAEEQKVTARLEDLDLEHQIMKDRLDLADQTLLTEGQLALKFDDLRGKTETITGRIQEVANSLHDDLYGSLQDVAQKIRDFNLFGTPERRASGGDAEGWTLVGENGPELARFPRGSHVYSNDQTRNMINNNQRTVNVHVSRMTINGSGSQRDLDRLVGGFAR